MVMATEDENRGKSGDERRRSRGRRRIDEVFGDVLPDTTSDERGTGQEHGTSGAHSDEWYRDNRPPHHDRL